MKLSHLTLAVLMMSASLVSGAESKQTSDLSLKLAQMKTKSQIQKLELEHKVQLSLLGRLIGKAELAMQYIDHENGSDESLKIKIYKDEEKLKKNTSYAQSGLMAVLSLAILRKAQRPKAIMGSGAIMGLAMMNSILVNVEGEGVDKEKMEAVVFVAYNTFFKDNAEFVNELQELNAEELDAKFVSINKEFDRVALAIAAIEQEIHKLKNK